MVEQGALMKKLLLLAVLATGTPLSAGTAWAESHLYNDLSFAVTVYWVAAGCAGVKEAPACARNWANIEFVCQTKTVGPGKTNSYSYPDGTSGRAMWVMGCDHNTSAAIRDDANSDNGGKKKRCAAIHSGADYKAECGYSDSEWSDLKSK
jgi:hypothetical protein